MIFQNRTHAGIMLGEYLKNNLKIINKNNWLILAIPRWGIPVAYEVWKILNIPISILVVKKLAPFNLPEYWFWAMAPDWSIIYDKNYMYQLWVSEKDLKKIKEKTLNEIKKRIEKYALWKLPNVKWKNVIIIDDWIATWYTAAVAAMWAKNNWANKVILAIPVCPAYINKDIAKNFDKIICLYPAENFQAVWQFYIDFHQITDDEYFDYITRMMSDN
jgi:putative phosphoribosyl transferase